MSENANKLDILTVLWYNGFEEEIEELLRHISSSMDSPDYCLRPESWYHASYNSPMGLLWSCLVLEFGDFGSSPRYGWIVDKLGAVNCLWRGLNI